jgi:hypothetical protein
MGGLGCPKCGRTPVVYFLSTRKWTCNHCKHEWTEEASSNKQAVLFQKSDSTHVASKPRKQRVKPPKKTNKPAKKVAKKATRQSRPAKLSKRSAKKR